MNDIELLLIFILILAYGVVFYICGKGDLFNVIALMLQDKAKELEERLKDTTEEEKTMNKEAKINLNQLVKFKLTDYGKDIYFHQYDELNNHIKIKGYKPIKPSMPKVDKDGFSTMQLWYFMELYGEHMGMAKPNIIEPLNLIFTITEEDGE